MTDIERASDSFFQEFRDPRKEIAELKQRFGLGEEGDPLKDVDQEKVTEYLEMLTSGTTNEERMAWLDEKTTGFSERLGIVACASLRLVRLGEEVSAKLKAGRGQTQGNFGLAQETLDLANQLSDKIQQNLELAREVLDRLTSK